jgi:cysteine desulfurase
LTYSDISRSIRELLDLHGKPDREVYLDHENSGFILPEALEAMMKAYGEGGMGHPSITHRLGWASYQSLYEATSTISSAIGCDGEEIVYTHSGTEANNLAIIGSALRETGDRKKIIISSIEHLSVAFPAEWLGRYGFKVLKIPVDDEGFVDLDYISDHVDKETLMVSVAAVNHEIGTTQDLTAIGEVVRDRDGGVLIHTDACDALGRLPINLGEMNLDLATFSSHKVYGPKGVGALYVREGVKLEPIIHGQMSTQKLWPGLENVPAILGFSKAVEIMHKNLPNHASRMAHLRDRLMEGIMGRVSHTLLNGPRGDRRAPDNLNMSFLYCEGEALTVELSMRGVYVSSGSACTSRVLEPSHVLTAIGRRYEEAHGSLLMKVSPFNTDSDIEYVLEAIPSTVERIRSLNPVKPPAR